MPASRPASPPPAPPRVPRMGLSIPEVMESLNLARQTVYDEIGAGRLRSYKVGARRLVSPAALDAYVADREAATAAERGQGGDHA